MPERNKLKRILFKKETNLKKIFIRKYNLY